MTSSTVAAPPAAGLNSHGSGLDLHPHPEPAAVAAHTHTQTHTATSKSLPATESALSASTTNAAVAIDSRPSNAPFNSASPAPAASTAPTQPAMVSESPTATSHAPASTSALTSTTSTSALPTTSTTTTATTATATATATAASVSAPSPRPSTPPPHSHPPIAVMEVDNHLSSQAGMPGAQDTAAAQDATSTDHPMPDAPVVAGSGTASQPAESESQPQSTTMQSHLPTQTDSEQYTPSTPFNQAPMPNFDQHYMMMALASMSGAASAMSPPPTVTPSQVTLPNLMDDTFHSLAPTNSIRQVEADNPLESFARIEFADSVFQMTTYAVIIGRDQRALEQARRDEKRAEEHRRRAEDNASKGLPPPSPIVQERGKFSKSYVSEEGGMLGPESENGDFDRPAKRRKTSTQGSSQHDNDEAQQAQENMISNRQYVSHTPGAAAVDLASLRPSPWHVPVIGIHSPGPNIASKTKAISREHLKIAYNQKEGVFEAIPLHKNGFFCEDVHYKSERVVLKCGDRLQIKDVDFRFLINGVERGRTGAEEEEEQPAPAPKKRTHGGKEMSFDFESSHANGEMHDTSDELSDVASPPELSDFGEEEDEADENEVVETVEAEPTPEQPTPEALAQVKQELASDPLQQHLISQIPKKRGPGRPPKNGIMSKREQRLLKKQQQEMAKKTIPQAPPMEPPLKRKVGRPRKHPLPESSGERPEKRKYKPRKPKEEGGEGSDAERRAREKKEKRARPKSPPLELKIEDYTEEQLAKPNKNYGMLIDETLTAAGPDGLTLKQIYKRICQRYPWFYFHTETKGWESSVRHNLIGNEAFKKDETTNLWSRVPGVELDAGKKRKASSPDRNLAAAQAYSQYPYGGYNAQRNPAAAPGYHPPNQPRPAYPVAGYGAQQPQPSQPGRPMQPPPYGTTAPPPTPGQSAPAAPSQPPAPVQLPGYGPPPAPARPQLGAPQPGAYSSPYARPPPPPATNPALKVESGHPQAAGSPIQQPPLATTAAKTIAGHAPVQPLQPGAAGPSAVAASASAAPLRPATTTTTANTAAMAAAATSATPSTSTTPSRSVIEPRLLQAVVGLKNGLVENLKKARNPKAEAIVMSALNRCIGLKSEATENEKMESICIKGIGQVIEGFTKNKSPTPGGGPSSETPPIFEAKVLQSLTGFKAVSIKALKEKLGEAKAEAVTLSAIDRVLGLADASIVPPPAEGESSVGNFEGVEQHLMKSIRQLLTGMNFKLQGTA
ncbi:hypothetical protein BGZ63DRAFT_384539 [Mariannaea sp. PMI_226]|nr:hypothetical protein BGZ63DRAFT_384539 [Mariannaea sp. PMI_226]